MAVMTTERPDSEEDAALHDEERRHAAMVRAIHDEIDPPEGWRVEIVDGKIEVSSTPFGIHAWILMEIREAITPSLPAGFKLYENVTFEAPGLNRYVPDLAAWPAAAMRTRTEWVFRGDECPLVVEVTSPHQESRDYRKADSYAQAGVPIYLLVDQQRRMCVVCTEPKGEQYTERHEIPFGKPVTVPLDPPVRIDTSEF